MDKFDYNIFRHNGNDIILLVKKTLMNCDLLINTFLKSDNKNIKIQSLIDCMYIINYYYSMAGLMQLVSGQNEWVQVDHIIEKYMNKFYTDNNILKTLARLKKTLTNEEHINLCAKMIKKGNEILSTYKLRTKIKYCVIDTQNNIEKEVSIDVPDELKIHFPTSVLQNIKDNKLPVDRPLYFYLQKKTRDSRTREHIEKCYMSKSIECFNKFAELLLLRHEYAKEMKYDNYFQYRRQGIGADSNDVTFLITDLMTKIEQRTKKEIARIHRELMKDGQDKKVDMNDVIYYHEKLKSKNKFSPLKTINVLFSLLEQYFKIKMKKITEYQSLWYSTVSIYEMYHDDCFVGTIYFDLLSRQCKNVITTTYVSLAHKYVNANNKNINYPRGVIVGNYDDLEDNCISYNEVAILFKEMGHAIQNILLNTTIGTHYSDTEFDGITGQAMELMAWEKSTIQKICSDINTSITLVDHIIFTKYIDFGITIKLKCLNALFDHIIHNSPSIINILTNSPNRGEILWSLYKKIYKDVMAPFNNILNIDIAHVNPNILIQETNGNEGMLYSNVLCEIFAYTIYQAIKHNKGKMYISNVLQKNISRKLIHEFIADMKINSYDLYLRNLIEFSEVDTELNLQEKEKYIDDITDGTNFFDDASDDENYRLHIDNIL